MMQQCRSLLTPVMAGGCWQCRLISLVKLTFRNTRPSNPQFVVPTARSLYSTGSAKLDSQTAQSESMKAWQIHNYKGASALDMAQARAVPTIRTPKEVLIKIHAASVNPIDVQMAEGYGQTLINLYRNFGNINISTSEFPLTLGRDFSGVVVDVGAEVKKYKAGDEVWGAINAKRQGTHAEFCIASETEMSKKPSAITHTEAAAIPFVAATTFASLVNNGGITEKNAKTMRVLILAGSGGLGTYAIQLMKSWGAEVATTCPADAISMLQQLGADFVYDFKAPDLIHQLENVGKFDVILDTLGGKTSDWALPLTKPGARYVDLAWDVVTQTDKHGVVEGMLHSGVNLIDKVWRAGTRGVAYNWAVFNPSHIALETSARLVDRGLIRPQIDSVFPFEQAIDAYEKVGSKKTRGKVVLDMTS